jgi:hypothetical protein
MPRPRRQLRDGDLIWLFKAGGFDPDHPPERDHERKVDTAHASRPTLTADGTLIIYWTSSLRMCVHTIRNVFDLSTGVRTSSDLGCRSDWP